MARPLRVPMCPYLRRLLRSQRERERGRAFASRPCLRPCGPYNSHIWANRAIERRRPRTPDPRLAGPTLLAQRREEKTIFPPPVYICTMRGLIKAVRWDGFVLAEIDRQHEKMDQHDWKAYVVVFNGLQWSSTDLFFSLFLARFLLRDSSGCVPIFLFLFRFVLLACPRLGIIAYEKRGKERVSARRLCDRLTPWRFRM